MSRRDGAAARLYVEYRDRIYRFCLSRLRSREDAEDAVQNVFMRVHTALDRGQVPHYEAAWLFKIAHNVCLSRAESRARRSSIETLSSFDDEVPVAAPEVSRDELAGLNEALEAMPHNLRTALLLREWQGLSYAEIAAAMDLSVSAVETLLFRARRHLANALEEEGSGSKKKSVVLRILDLLGLNWLRELLTGGGPAAELAAGAAVLALGGGGAAIALTTDAHARPSPAPVVSVHGTSVVQQRQVVAAPTPVAAAETTAVKGVARITQARTPSPVEPSTTSTPPRAVTTSGSPTPTRPHVVAVAPATPALVPSTTPAPIPTVPSTPVPTIPAATAPTVSVPTVTAPAVSVPAVSLPVVGGVVGG